MIKKFGTVAVGVTAGMLAMAPIASAGDHHHGHGGNIDCSATGGDVEGNEGGGALGVGSAADGNAGQVLSCNSFLNDNGNDNEMLVGVADDA